MEIKEIVEVLRKGGLILYPTDTVWGIGCDATNEQAVRKVFELKKRDDSKSLVLLASDLDMVCHYVKELPFMAESLVELNDAPMTIIYPGAMTGPGALAPSTVTADGTVGIRIPMSDFCKGLCSRLGRPIVSTSANISGEATPKGFDDISSHVKEGVDLVVDPALGSEATGRPSQIIMLGLGGEVKIIRG